LVREDHQQCNDVALYEGPTNSKADCEMKCLLDPSCRFFTLRKEEGKQAQCLTTSICRGKRSIKAQVFTYKNLLKAPPKEIKVIDLGMYDSGTNTLKETLLLNFPTCNGAGGSNQRSHLRSKFKVVTDLCLRFQSIYKHVNPAFLLESLSGVRRNKYQPDPHHAALVHSSEVVVLAMVRDPFSHLHSWNKAPYDIDRCKGKGKTKDQTWMTRPCTFYESRGSRGGGTSGGNFSSVVDLWNKYTNGYLDLQRSGLFKKVLIIRYEDLVLKPERIVAQIAESTGVPLDGELVLAERASKSTGHANGREKAVKKIKTRGWLQHISISVRPLICEQLNMTLGALLRYNNTDVCAAGRRRRQRR
jgi:hypothetical protein